MRDEREAKPFSEVARDLRAPDLKKHMHYEPAIKIEKVRMPHDEMAHFSACASVDSLVSKALMSRMELRCRMHKTYAVQHSK